MQRLTDFLIVSFVYGGYHFLTWFPVETDSMGIPEEPLMGNA